MSDKTKIVVGYTTGPGLTRYRLYVDGKEQHIDYQDTMTKKTLDKAIRRIQNTETKGCDVTMKAIPS